MPTIVTPACNKAVKFNGDLVRSTYHGHAVNFGIKIHINYYNTIIIHTYLLINGIILRYCSILYTKKIFAEKFPFCCYMYSRLSLFRLSEMRPPRYTGHLVWHGMLAICFLHKTRPEVRPLAIPFTGQCWLSQNVFNVILYVLRLDMMFWVWFSK